MKHDVSMTFRRTCTFPDVRIQTWRLLNAAELCQMLRAESDGPSTFHWTSDVSPCLDQLRSSGNRASTLSGSVPRKGSYRDLATLVTSAMDPLATIPSLVRSGS